MHGRQDALDEATTVRGAAAEQAFSLSSSSSLVHITLAAFRFLGGGGGGGGGGDGGKAGHGEGGDATVLPAVQRGGGRIRLSTATSNNIVNNNTTSTWPSFASGTASCSGAGKGAGCLQSKAGPRQQAQQEQPEQPAPDVAEDHGSEAELPTALESVKAKLADTMREPGLATLSNGLQALAAAGFEGDEQAVGILLGSGKDDVDEGSPVAGYTAASIAAFKGELGCLKLLVEHGADLGKASRDGATAVFRAVVEGHIDCLSFLQEHGCDLSTPHNDGRTPVYIAVWQGHIDCLRFLQEHGCDLSTPDNYGRSSAYIAAQEGHFDCLRFLQGHGCDLSTPANDGRTPVHIAARQGHVDCLDFLLSCRADAVSTFSGQTPLQVAQAQGHTACVDMLQRYTSRPTKGAGAR
jgi:ankyrin repeat protein